MEHGLQLCVNTPARTEGVVTGVVADEGAQSRGLGLIQVILVDAWRVAALIKTDIHGCVLEAPTHEPVTVRDTKPGFL